MCRDQPREKTLGAAPPLVFPLGWSLHTRSQNTIRTRFARALLHCVFARMYFRARVQLFLDDCSAVTTRGYFFLGDFLTLNFVRISILRWIVLNAIRQGTYCFQQIGNPSILSVWPFFVVLLWKNSNNIPANNRSANNRPSNKSPTNTSPANNILWNTQ